MVAIDRFSSMLFPEMGFPQHTRQGSLRATEGAVQAAEKPGYPAGYINSALLGSLQADAWYASLWKEEQWKFHDENRIARRELVSFEESGRQLEVLEYSAQNH
jgi:hypothetical protein